MTDVSPTPPSGSEGSYVPPTPPPSGTAIPPPSGPPAGSDRTLMLILSYLGILVLIPLLTKKEDKEIQWHAKNGLVFLGAFLVLAIVTFIVDWILPTAVSCLLSIIWCVVPVGYLVL